MSMYSNEFVCISLFFHDHARLLVCACMCVCVNLCVHMCSFTSMWMHNCVYVCTRYITLQTSSTKMNSFLCINECVFAYVFVHVHVFVCVCLCMCMCVCMKGTANGRRRLQISLFVLYK